MLIQKDIRSFFSISPADKRKDPPVDSPASVVVPKKPKVVDPNSFFKGPVSQKTESIVTRRPKIIVESDDDELFDDIDPDTLGELVRLEEESTNIPSVDAQSPLSSQKLAGADATMSASTPAASPLPAKKPVTDLNDGNTTKSVTQAPNMATVHEDDALTNDTKPSVPTTMETPADQALESSNEPEKFR